MWAPKRSLCNKDCGCCQNGKHVDRAQRISTGGRPGHELEELYAIPKALPRELCEWWRDGGYKQPIVAGLLGTQPIVAGLLGSDTRDGSVSPLADLAEGPENGEEVSGDALHIVGFPAGIPETLSSDGGDPVGG